MVVLLDKNNLMRSLKLLTVLQQFDRSTLRCNFWSRRRYIAFSPNFKKCSNTNKLQSMFGREKKCLKTAYTTKENCFASAGLLPMITKSKRRNFDWILWGNDSGFNQLQNTWKTISTDDKFRSSRLLIKLKIKLIKGNHVFFSLVANVFFVIASPYLTLNWSDD